MMNIQCHRPGRRSLPAVLLGASAGLILLSVPTAEAQTPAASPATRAVQQLMQRDVVAMAGKEVLVDTVEYPPGGSSKPHRHDAQVFVYVLQGNVKMQVKGGPLMTLGPGQTFYEGPSDIHAVSANASASQPAKILVFMIKDKGKPTTRVVPQQEQ